MQFTGDGSSMSYDLVTVLISVLCVWPSVLTPLGASTPAGTSLSLFVPAETTACLGLIPGPCVLVQQPEVINDTCAKTNIAQLAADITSADTSQAISL